MDPRTGGRTARRAAIALATVALLAPAGARAEFKVYEHFIYGPPYESSFAVGNANTPVVFGPEGILDDPAEYQATAAHQTGAMVSDSRTSSALPNLGGTAPCVAGDASSACIWATAYASITHTIPITTPGNWKVQSNMDRVTISGQVLSAVSGLPLGGGLSKVFVRVTLTARYYPCPAPQACASTLWGNDNGVMNIVSCQSGAACTWIPYTNLDLAAVGVAGSVGRVVVTFAFEGWSTARGDALGRVRLTGSLAQLGAFRYTL